MRKNKPTISIIMICFFYISISHINSLQATLFNDNSSTDDPYSILENRLNSYETWEYEGVQKALQLAKAGFYYTGEKDIVRCYDCGLGISEWNKDECPWVQHARYSVHCDHLITTQGYLFVNNIKEEWAKVYNPKHLNFQEKSARLATFTNLSKSIRQKPEDFASAGFFYTGDGDTVRCHYCDGGLSDWEPNDDPMKEHAAKFPFCKFISKIKGNDYIYTILKENKSK